MNKDFEIIRHFLNSYCAPMDSLEYDILAAASRMAEQIAYWRENYEQANAAHDKAEERIKAQNGTFEKMANHIGFIENALHDAQTAKAELTAENEQLRVTLAQRPEVVRCGECKNYCFIPAYACDVCILAMDYNTKLRDFCSRAVRKESEEK